MTWNESGDLLQRIDPICEQFELAWQSGETPRFETFVESFAGDDLQVLLRYLLEIDRDYRNSKGLPSSLEHYEKSHPDLAGKIRIAYDRAKDSTLRQIGTDTATQDAGGENYAAKVADLSHRDGNIIGNYELIEKLGEGGMGTVFLAEQKQPVVRQVALKVISSGISSKEVLNRFEAERQAMAMMDHPNIARILDAGTTPTGEPFFAMELVQGEPLTKYVDRKKLDINARLELICAVASGVQHAHQKGIIHRDLKPSNILVAEVDGKAVPKVIDFGLAKAMESTQRLTDSTLNTEVGQILGTLKYMSPEQAGLNPNDIDVRTDIYALGVILYQLLTGMTPLTPDLIHGQPMFQILENIREKEPLKPSSQLSQYNQEHLSDVTSLRGTDSKRLHSLLAGDLDWIVMKAIEKDRTRRYESASGFAEDVRRFLENEPIAARPPSVGYRVRKFATKHRGLVTAISLVLIVLLFGMIGTTSGMLRASQAKDLANRRLVNAQDAEERERKQRKAAEEAQLVAEEAQREAEDAQQEAEEAQRKAEQEAQISAEINRFFNDDILGQADVQRSVKDITVRDALLRSARRIEGRFDEMPVVEGEIRRTIGRSLCGLAKFEEGVEQLLKSEEILKTALHADHTKVMRTVGELGRAYRDWEKYKEARPYLETYLEWTVGQFGEDSSQAVQAMHMYGMTLDNLGEVDEADRILTKVLNWRRENLGNDHPQTIRTTLMLGALYLYNDRITESEPLVVEAAEAAERVMGDGNYVTMIANDNLSQFYLETGRYSEAEPIVLRGLELVRANLGEVHPGYAATLSKLADLYTKTDRIEEAVEMRRELVVTNEKVFGARSEPAFNARLHLTSALAKNAQYDEANNELLAIQSDVIESLGEMHPFTIVVENELGQLDFKQEDYEAASEHFRTARQMGLDRYGEKHQLTQSASNLLANAAWMQKDYETARTTWRARLDSVKEQGGGLPLILGLSRQVAMADLKLGDVESAKSVIFEIRPQFDAIPQEAIEMQTNKHRMLLDLSNCHLQLEEFEEAEAVAREVLEFDGWEEDKLYRGFRAHVFLGIALAKQESYAEAEGELTKGYDGLVANESSTTDKQRAIEGLIDLFEATDRAEEAATWQTKLDELLTEEDEP